MVVIHPNRPLIRNSGLCFLLFVTVLLLVHKFEIAYHPNNTCTCDEPIDVVYTWVNGSDPKFLTNLNNFLRNHKGLQADSSPRRYSDKNELKYSLRSLEKFAPWVRHVYIVTNGQIPYWLNLDYERVTVITHDEIFVDKYHLPTFSSPAIETHLHRIPGVSNRFIYFNDDIFLSSPIYKDDFISPSRGFLIYLAWLLPPCAPECSWLFVSDGNCDGPCNNLNCQMDGGDCVSVTPSVNESLPKSNTSEHFILSIANSTNVSEVITKHNKNVILLDKLRRRKVRKHLRREFKAFGVDAYAASLQHTNRILNDFYGFSVRKVPAHAPILVDKKIMIEAQEKLHKFFAKTARNRVRSVDDVQFAFAYYYYIMHELKHANVGDIFDEFDTDSSKSWSETEMRTVVTKLFEIPISESDLKLFDLILTDCLKQSSRRVITKEFVRKCPALVSLLETNLGTSRRFKYEVVKDAEKKFVHFKMLNSNITEMINQLDDVRKNAKRFVCLNDNLDESFDLDNDIMVKILDEFYRSLFPRPSKFELPENYMNRFLYVEDYVALMNQQRRKLILVSVGVIVIISGGLLNVFRRDACDIIIEWLY